MNADSIYARARQIPAGKKRDAFLTEVCGDDSDLRRRVESRLAEDVAETQIPRDTEQFASEPAATQIKRSELSAKNVDKPSGKPVTPPENLDITSDKLQTDSIHPSADERPGQQLGRYELLKVLGEGGFGVVWLAEQQEPVKRQVALKVIKLGMDTVQVIRRFEAERQSLAVMDHPNIAKVFDAGATQTGRPYFVMELVSGISITEYCDAEKLDFKARLKLFISICNALQHAHQKGIIHRDIKPGNVLVTSHDDVATVKVIDFGIAKATNPEAIGQSVYTQTNQVIGTPLYMSPEQADNSQLDIDTRSDIYSLGVLLYELLTGTTPFTIQELTKNGYSQMLRMICEEQPPRPSTRVSSLNEADSKMTVVESVDRKQLADDLKGDLDWIVMKCLEKDRDRRYETANGLAADIKNYLDDEPVDARPPSKRYRLQKFIKRNRVGVMAAVAVAATILLGTIGTVAGLVWALDEREQARRHAEEVEQVAEFQSAQLADINVEQMGSNMRQRLLEEARAGMTLGGRTPLEIDEREAQLAALLAGTNFTNLALDTLGENFFDRTIEAIDEQFHDQPLVQARLLQTLGSTMGELGLLQRAVKPARRALAIRRERLGDDHPDTIEAIETLAKVLEKVGDPTEVLKLLREAAERNRRLFGYEHPKTMEAWHRLGDMLYGAGEQAEGMQLTRETLERRRRVLGEVHRSTIESLTTVGLQLGDQGELAEGLALLREATEKSRQSFGPDDPLTVQATLWLSTNLQLQGLLSEAETHAVELLESCRRLYGDDHQQTAQMAVLVGTIYGRQERWAEAEARMRESLEVTLRAQGPDHIDIAAPANNLAFVLIKQDRHEDAIKVLKTHLPTADRAYSGDNRGLFGNYLVTLGMAQTGQEDFEAAESTLQEASDIVFESYGKGNRRNIKCLNALVDLYAAWHVAKPESGHNQTAEKWRAELDAAMKGGQ